jgi:hypothetical protein
MTLPDSAIDSRPWPGKDATTQRTMDEFRESLEGGPQHGDWPEWLTRAAVSICRAYGIKGICDPAYIANVINNERLGIDR